MIRIYDIDSCEDIAKKIYHNFEIGDMCQVYGWETIFSDQTVKAKGLVVMAIIKEMYERENLSPGGIRKYKFKPDSIGGPIAHKIFVYQKVIIENQPRVTIWRFQ